MVNFADVHDAGARIVTKNALNPQTVTAGSTADGTEQNGASIDRLTVGNNQTFRSLKVSLPYNASYSTGTTGQIDFNLQHSSATSAGWADYDDIDGSTANSVTLTTGASGVAEADFDLGGAKQYVRVQVTVTHGTTASDDVDIGGVAVLAGGETPQND